MRFGTGRIDKVEDGLEKALWLPQGMAADDDSGAAMAFASIIEGEFDFGPLGKMPLSE